MKFLAGRDYQELKGASCVRSTCTRCASARCPNMGECWEHRTATFAVKGNMPRACGFARCRVGDLSVLQRKTSQNVAEAVERMGLRYAVVTSVSHSDQPGRRRGDLRAHNHENSDAFRDAASEVLIPDFRGDWSALEALLAARLDQRATVWKRSRAFTGRVRKGAVYERSLEFVAARAQIRN